LAFGRSRPLSVPIETNFSNGFPPSVFVLPSGRGGLNSRFDSLSREKYRFFSGFHELGTSKYRFFSKSHRFGPFRGCVNNVTLKAGGASHEPKRIEMLGPLGFENAPVRIRLVELVQSRAPEGPNRNFVSVYLPCELSAESSALAFPLRSTKSFGGAGNRQVPRNTFAKPCRVTGDMRSHACCWGRSWRGNRLEEAWGARSQAASEHSDYVWAYLHLAEGRWSRSQVWTRRARPRAFLIVRKHGH
jgi:hypothetical protein